MDTSFILFWLHLCATSGLGATRLAVLAEAFNASGEFCEQRLLSLVEKVPHTPRQQVLRWLAKPSIVHLPMVDDWLQWTKQPNHQLIILPDPLYPAMLRILPDPPPMLFAKGLAELLWQPQLAIVGSRNPTVSGRENAFHFARELAKKGFTITSGLALGVDGAAHNGALPELGSTIAVLGSGLNIIYPARHRSLAHQISETGLLVSELPLDAPPKAANFPRRNRIISGLTLGTLVVEASIRSGSLITARLALEQGREVFAIPGSIQNPQARGCHYLIKQGAKLAETTDDIFSELPQLMRAYQQKQLSSVTQFKTVWAAELLTDDNAAAQPLRQHTREAGLSAGGADKPASVLQSEEVEQRLPASFDLELNPVARLVLDAVGYEATHIDIIVARTGIGVSEVQAQLIQLELSGLVRAERGGVVKLCS